MVHASRVVKVAEFSWQKALLDHASVIQVAAFPRHPKLLTQVGRSSNYVSIDNKATAGCLAPRWGWGPVITKHC